jgi:hypothetical protein
MQPVKRNQQKGRDKAGKYERNVERKDARHG